MNIYNHRLHGSRSSFIVSEGFTLIELLVVISLIGMLASVIIASLSTARNKGKVGAGLLFADNTYHALGSDAIGIFNFNNGVAGDNADMVDSSGNIGVDISAYCGSAGNSVKKSADTSAGSGLSINIASLQYCFLNLDPRPILSGNGYSFSIWVKPVNVLAYKPFLLTTTNTIDLEVDASYIKFMTGYKETSGNIMKLQVPSSIISPGVWNNLAGSINYSTNEAVLYFNGSQVGKTTVSGTGPSLKKISSIHLGVNTFLTGNLLLDDFFLYNQSMTAYDARSIYASGLKTHQLADAK